ncbi:hypothetical protein INT43_008022 [Umbelopsis isabellina]|uniref:Pyrroloquinoline quinone-dependent pyranose dehydrogenase beta-propeller domain-containing protein n=1 Tax=Mortierella isabellina TaxID=91625 RepID=A0A8H7UC07_MORIS|nr:hypothetical protein INT43_008022 [Umbelopsis isabellina]
MAILSIRKALLLTLAISFVVAQEDTTASDDAAVAAAPPAEEASTLPDATAVGAAPPTKHEKPKNCNPAPVIQPSNPVTAIPGYEAVVLTNIENPRSIAVDDANHFLVLSGADNSIYSLREDACGNVDKQLVLNGSILGAAPLREGLIAFREHLYVTTGDAVVRFKYSPGQHSQLSTQPEIVVRNIGEQGLPITIDPRGNLFIPKGFSQAQNGGTQVRRYDVSKVPQDGYDYENAGAQFTAASANGAGPLAYDTQGKIWGTSIMGDYEQLSLFDITASENTTIALGTKTSDIKFYRGLGCSVGDPETMGTTDGMPCRWTDHAFLAAPNAGIIHIPYSDLAHAPMGAPETLFGQSDLSGCGAGNSCVSPTSMAFDRDGRILSVSTATNEIWIFRRIYNKEAGKLLTDKANAYEAAKEAADEAAEEAAELKKKKAAKGGRGSKGGKGGKGKKIELTEAEAAASE